MVVIFGFSNPQLAGADTLISVIFLADMYLHNNQCFCFVIFSQSEKNTKIEFRNSDFTILNQPIRNWYFIWLVEIFKSKTSIILVVSINWWKPVKIIKLFSIFIAKKSFTIIYPKVGWKFRTKFQAMTKFSK